MNHITSRRPWAPDLTYTQWHICMSHVQVYNVDLVANVIPPSELHVALILLIDPTRMPGYVAFNLMFRR